MNSPATDEALVEVPPALRPVYPPGRFFHCWATFAVLLTLWGYTPPGGYILSILAGTLFCFITALIWVTRVAIFTCDPTRARLQSKCFLINCGSWSATPLLLALTYLAVDSDVPPRMAFYFSRPALERLAQNVMETPDIGRSYSRVGCYRLREVSKTSWGVKVTIKGGFLGSYGFAYSPHQALTTEEVTWSEETFRYTPIGDGWYQFVS